MENDNDFKEEIKISKNNGDGDIEEDNNLNDKKNLYLKISDDYHLENELNEDNDIGIEIDNDIFMNNNQENFSDLTQYQIERLNQIREEAQLRSEKYSELSTVNSNINSKDTNVISNTNEISNNDKNDLEDINDNMSQLSNNFINNDYEDNLIKEINPNLDRFFDTIHPFFFINNEPLLVVGPDAIHFIIIFTISSLLSIIFYSIKNTYFIMKFLYLLSYLLYIISYTLLMVLNPGIPTNKNNIDLEELKRNYKQCTICNCISSKNSDYITFHCNKCNICVEDYTHHCFFASKCVGKKNKLIFKIWLFSIPIYLIIIFLYIII